MKRKYRRRNFLLDKNFQLRVIFIYLALFGISFWLSNTMINSYWLSIVVGGLVLVLVSIFLTHRMVGPIYRFEKSLERMIDGDLSFSIALRKNDECKPLADSFNRFNTVLSSKIKAMTRLAEKVDNHLVELDAVEKSPLDETAIKNLQEAITLNRRLKNILFDFSIEKDVGLER